MTNTAHRASVNIVRPRSDVTFVTRFDRRGWQALAALGSLVVLVMGWHAVWTALPR